MARPKKSGLDYFPVDVDIFSDEKVAFLSAKFGLLGEAILFRLLAKIYRNGYYCAWDEDVKLLFCSNLKMPIGYVVEETVEAVVQELLKRNLLDREKFEQFGILTGRGIQKRYLRACEDSKRKSSVIDEQYLLIGIYSENLGNNSRTSDENEELFGSKPGFPPEKPLVFPEFSTQTKQNKTKENKTKENKTKEKNTIANGNNSRGNGSFLLFNDFGNEAALDEIIVEAYEYYLEKSPHPSETSGIKNQILKDQRFLPDTAWSIVLEAFEAIVTVGEENKNTRFLYGIIRNKKDKVYADYRDAKLRKEKEEERRSMRSGSVEAAGSVRSVFEQMTGQHSRDKPNMQDILRTPEPVKQQVIPLPN
jgi:hypothetical protein